ncbi:alpha/beta fold hydrolase [Aurantibacillus circumpalustris]|uniref:alpha/beta fold hydrolase n=1 Tax=Aurantibacillus circumpalustris TaxID=3036359 RepID=UPI00295B9BFE|nr:alpha/beta fold hydrolase [Aurantibacillus circumpalustris]
MKLAFREFGNGQPLIILHGLFGQSDNWNTHAKSFSEKGFHVFAIDQRNHGLSPHSDVWNYEAMADDLKEFIDEHQLKNPILLGHSMGGKTVMYFERKYKGIASKIIIADISARAYPPHHQEVLAALKAVDFTKISTRKEAEELMNKYIKDFGTKQFLLKNIYWKDNSNNVMDWRFNLKVIDANYENVCMGVPEFSSEVKTLIIKGEKSHYISDSDKEDLKKRFPNSTFVVLNGAGHWVHAEKPKEFFETTLWFITN